MIFTLTTLRLLQRAPSQNLFLPPVPLSVLKLLYPSCYSPLPVRLYLCTSDVAELPLDELHEPFHWVIFFRDDFVHQNFLTILDETATLNTAFSMFGFLCIDHPVSPLPVGYA